MRDEALSFKETKAHVEALLNSAIQGQVAADAPSLFSRDDDRSRLLSSIQEVLEQLATITMQLDQPRAEISS